MRPSVVECPHLDCRVAFRHVCQNRLSIRYGFIVGMTSYSSHIPGVLSLKLTNIPRPSPNIKFRIIPSRNPSSKQSSSFRNVRMVSSKFSLGVRVCTMVLPSSWKSPGRQANSKGVLHPEDQRSSSVREDLPTDSLKELCSRTPGSAPSRRSKAQMSPSQRLAAAYHSQSKILTHECSPT